MGTVGSLGAPRRLTDLGWSSLYGGFRGTSLCPLSSSITWSQSPRCRLVLRIKRDRNAKRNRLAASGCGPQGSGWDRSYLIGGASSLLPGLSCPPSLLPCLLSPLTPLLPAGPPHTQQSRFGAPGLLHPRPAPSLPVALEGRVAMDSMDPVKVLLHRSSFPGNGHPGPGTRGEGSPPPPPTSPL